MSAYDFCGDKRRRYDATLAVLVQVVRFWPPVPSLQMAARKWNTVAVLDMIAAKNGWMRPRTTVLTPGCTIPGGTVIKRSHGECGNFVILPDTFIQGTGASSNAERVRLNGLRSWAHLHKTTHSDEQTWVSQEYVPTLVSLGEWRCFIVGGHVASVVHTRMGDEYIWRARRVWQFLSLREIRCVLHGDHMIIFTDVSITFRELWLNRHAVPVTWEVVMNPDRGDRDDRREGWADLCRFVDKVYQELARTESRTSGTKSSLTVFCRMDVGLIFDDDGNPSYFVNEIERSPTMSMWLRAIDDTSNRFMLDTFARVLHTHITDLDNIYT